MFQSGPNQKWRLFYGPVFYFGTGLLIKQSSPVRSQSHGLVRPV